MADSLLDAVVSQAARKILEKLEKGKKLTVEDLLLLHLDLQYRELRELRGELGELRRELAAEIRGVRGEITQVRREVGEARSETAERLDSLRRELLERLEALRRELTLRMEELGRRVDRLYELQAGEGRG